MNAGVTASRRHLALLVASFAVVVGTVGTVESTGQLVAGTLLVGGVGLRSRGMAALVGWIVAGAVLGGLGGYAIAVVMGAPSTAAVAAGLGIALGGGIGGISHLLSTDDPETVDDERMTVDMASESAPEPRPADLFDDHPDPVLYVTTAGTGPVVRAANAAYAEAFDLPAATLEDAPLGDVLVATEDVDGVVEDLAAGEAVDVVLGFETPDGERRFRVRSVAATTDGYLLFTPVDG